MEFWLQWHEPGQPNKDATDFPIPDYRLWDIDTFAFVKWKYNRIIMSEGVRCDPRCINGDPLFIITNPNTGFEKQTSSNKAEARQQFSAFNKNFSGMTLSLGGTYGLNDHIWLIAVHTGHPFSVMWATFYYPQWACL